MNVYREALLELLTVVGNHPDAMFWDGPLNAAFTKAVKVIQQEPLQELADALEMTMCVECGHSNRLDSKIVHGPMCSQRESSISPQRGKP